MHDVFISHSATDKTIADAVCAKLEAEGVRCWIAPRDVLPGAEWSEAIIDAINECRVMVIIVSSSANNSKHLKREVERAVNRGSILIPFRIEDVPLSKSLELFISTAHWLDALTPPFEGHLQYLADTVNLLLKRRDGGTGAIRPVMPPKPRPFAQPYFKLAAAAVVLVVVLVAAYLLLMKPSGNESSNQNAQGGAAGSNRSSRRADTPQSVEAYNEAIQKNPNDAAAYLGRGEVYRMKGDYDRAIADYTQAIKLNPKSADAYSARGRVQMMKRDYDSAIADYSEAAKLDPNNPDFQRVVSRLQELRKLEKK